MTTWKRQEHTVPGQKVQRFTGEGAYHGSTKRKLGYKPLPVGEVVAEARPTTLQRYLEAGQHRIDLFDARFPNSLKIVDSLGEPTQEDVRVDALTFCWCPFDEAQRVAGPLTKKVLAAMRPHLSGEKRFTYIDSKIQYFTPGDLPVDSCLWHVDGSIAVRDRRVEPFGVSILHDIKARLDGDDSPRYLAYQSSTHCATGFLNRPIDLRMPEMIRDFNEFDRRVRSMEVREMPHPAGAIIAYDGLTLHRANPATSRGWRLWIRCIETDVKIQPNESVINCYGTVFRPALAA